MINHSFRRQSFVLLASIAFCLIQGWEFIFRSWDHVNDLGDAFINLWILAWDSHALFDPNLSVWDAPQFYPLKNTLALSENMFANLLIYFPFYLVTGNPVFSSNMVGIISFVLCAYCGYLLVEEVTGNFWAGLTGGFIFSFSPYKWAHFSHLQLLPFFWAPLAVLFTHRFFNDPKPKYFYGIAVTTTIQYYHSIYLGAMLTSALLTLFLIHLFLERKKEERWVYFKKRQLFRHILQATLLAGLFLAPIGAPYIIMASRWNIVRSFAENRIFSAEPLSFLYPNSFLNYEWLRKLLENSIQGGETQVFMGFVPLTLALVGIFTLRSQKNTSENHSKKILLRYLIAAFAMAILMMGPYLQLFGKDTGIPLPYQLVHTIIPGGAAMRAPARFFQLLLLFVAILAGFGFKRLIDWAHVKNLSIKVTIFIGFGALFFLDYQVLFYPGVKAEEKKDFPLVYKYLGETNLKTPYLELPTENPFDFKYLLYQTASWKPTLNGKSGWAPPATHQITPNTIDCPSQTCLKFLEAVPAKTVLTHFDRTTKSQRILWEKIDWPSHGFSLKKRIGNSLVLEKDKFPKPAKELEILQVYFTEDQYGVAAFLMVQPAGGNKHWNHLGPERSVIKISLNSSEKIEKEVLLPPYVFSETPISIPLTRLVKLLDKSKQVAISGEKIKPFKMTKDSIVFLNARNTSQNKQNGLLSKLLDVSYFSKSSVYSPEDKILLNAKVLNAGKAYWLHKDYNNLLRDTDDGTVFLAAEWFSKKQMSSCARPNTQPVSAIYKTLSNIIAPQETAKFEALITVPKAEGDYTLWIGLGSANVTWFHDVGPSQVKCIDFSVKNNS